MNFLYLLAPPLSAAVKATAQGSFTKKRVTTFSNAAAFNALVFAFTAVIFSALFVRKLPSLELLVYAALSAIFIAGFQFSYTLAFKNGAVAPAVIINTFNVIFPLLTGAIFTTKNGRFLRLSAARVWLRRSTSSPRAETKKKLTANG